MKPIKIAENVYKIGALDWNRRLFDSLIPIPKGTTYNSYWVEGKEKTALIDTVEPAMWEVLEDQISKATRLDYIVSNHAEQDHSGCIPNVLQRFPKAKVVTNSKAKGMIMDLLSIEESQFQIVNDGDSLDLGGKTLRFALTPWVHWPETMVTYLEEDKILFSCDFFGSHLASSKIYADEDYEVYDAAKRYYAEIMMPFAREVAKNMEKVSKWNIQLIAPSHGPMYNKPEFIFNAYKEWISDKPKNKAIVVYISMHGSIQKMAQYLTSALADKGVEVKLYDLTVMDLGEVAMDLVDAATIVMGTPVVLGGAHPNALYAAYLVNLLQPKLKFAGFLSSFGWGGKAIRDLQDNLNRLKVEILPVITSKGSPKNDAFHGLDELAETIRIKHQELLGKP